jgi:hypothetical protein
MKSYRSKVLRMKTALLSIVFMVLATAPAYALTVNGQEVKSSTHVESHSININDIKGIKHEDEKTGETIVITPAATSAPTQAPTVVPVIKRAAAIIPTRAITPTIIPTATPTAVPTVMPKVNPKPVVRKSGNPNFLQSIASFFGGALSRFSSLFK